MENEILTVFGKLIDALTQRRDADAALALFADDEDVTFWGSRDDDIAVGPVAVASMVREITAANHQVHTSFPQRRVSIVGDVGWVNAMARSARPRPGRRCGSRPTGSRGSSSAATAPGAATRSAAPSRTPRQASPASTAVTGAGGRPSSCRASSVTSAQRSSRIAANMLEKA